MITIRFRDFPGESSYGHFCELIELATGQKVTISRDESSRVDLEITGPYGRDANFYKTPLIKRIKRLGYIVISNGRHLAIRNLASGIQPSKNALKSIWYTGENVRPPQGTWNGYISFDTNLPKDRNVYLPLWFLTSTDLFKSTTKSYWGGKVPKIEELTQRRKFSRAKGKFVVSFIGKMYPMRLHAIEALSKIGEVDIFGESARNKVNTPSKVASNYNFTLCFENDIYPGYVTEKPIESYLSGTVPLYYGLDTLGYLNPAAMVNLMDFSNVSDWIERIKHIKSNLDSYKEVYEEPMLLKTPSLEEAINLIRKILKD